MDRRYVLAGVAVVVGLGAAFILRSVLGTVFLAGTVAYVLAPVDRWYVRRGMPNWWSALLTTVTGVGIATLVLTPLLAVLYLRFGALQALLTDVPIPEELTLSLFGYTETVQLVQLQDPLLRYLESVALGVASAAPVVAIKATLFAIVLFALLLARGRLHDAVRGVVPPEYHGSLTRLTGRARDTLLAIYVLQAAIALITFVVAVPVFFLLGYQYPFTLATLAGFLQFLPIVGPSVLVLGVAAVDVALGNLTRAALVAVAGLVLVGYMPDLARPRLARRTADLPGSLYFVGFTGGLFTLGVVGVVAGPLVVALLSESVKMLAEEMNGPRDRQSALGTFGAPAGDAPDGDTARHPAADGPPPAADGGDAAASGDPDQSRPDDADHPPSDDTVDRSPPDDAADSPAEGGTDPPAGDTPDGDERRPE